MAHMNTHRSGARAEAAALRAEMLREAAGEGPENAKCS